jgi:hypothetical protein
LNRKLFRFQALDFQLASNANSSDYTERDCDSLGLGVDVLGVSKLLNKDYVIIPDGVRINNGLKTYASKFCGSSLMKQEVIGELTIILKYSIQSSITAVPKNKKKLNRVSHE